MNLRTKLAYCLSLAALVGFFGACSVIPEAAPDTTRYYVLTAATASESPAPGATPPRVALRPVVLPEFLRGRIMQVRIGQNEVRFMDDARWAEPLESGLNRVLHDNLAQRASAVRIVTRTGEQHDYDVAVHIRHFEGVLPKHAAGISARIEVYSTDQEPKLVAQDDFATEIPNWDGKDHAQLAQKLSDATSALSDRIIALIPSPKG